MSITEIARRLFRSAVTPPRGVTVRAASVGGPKVAVLKPDGELNHNNLCIGLEVLNYP